MDWTLSVLAYSSQRSDKGGTTWNNLLIRNMPTCISYQAFVMEMLAMQRGNTRSRQHNSYQTRKTQCAEYSGSGVCCICWSIHWRSWAAYGTSLSQCGVHSARISCKTSTTTVEKGEYCSGQIVSLISTQTLCEPAYFLPCIDVWCGNVHKE